MKSRLIKKGEPIKNKAHKSFSSLNHVFQRTAALFGSFKDYYVHIGGFNKSLDLFLVSFLGLFFEILLIRHLSTELRIFAYYKNLPLISAFLGLGVGFAASNRKTSFFPFFPLIISIYSLVIMFLPDKFLSGSPAETEFIWSYAPGNLSTTLIFYALFLAFFLFNTLVFVPLGQHTGKLMQRFSPIKAYTINILGSLAGTWAFSVLSSLSLSPIYWFAFGFTGTAILFRSQRRFLFLSSVLTGLCLLVLFANQGDSLWSPYYKIDIDPLVENDLEYGYNLTVNQDYHQRILNLSEEYISEQGFTAPFLSKYAYAYDLPYYVSDCTKVLILGAGAGNDAAAALRHGAEVVHAVEIDRDILQLGFKLHPEKPYHSSKVTTYVDDARSFLHRTDENYDMIVYGLLDSHTMLSARSSIRLDNFVYTLDSFRDATEHLKENGTIALTFSVNRRWIGQRIFNMLTEVYAEEPLVFSTFYDGSVLFVTGPGVDDFNVDEMPDFPLLKLRHANKYSYDPEVAKATDDWPFLYLEKRRVPIEYWIMIILITATSILVIRAAFPEALNVNFHFFFLGSAFLLLQIKSITQLALLFGSTWVVNSIVISAALGVILLANLYVSRIKIERNEAYYFLLFLSLCLSYSIPADLLLAQPTVIKIITSAAITGMPLFFAGIIFASSLKKSPRIERAFASNLLGAILGGLFEYSALSFGIRNLLIFTALMYALSFLLKSRGRTA